MPAMHMGGTKMLLQNVKKDKEKQTDKAVNDLELERDVMKEALNKKARIEQKILLLKLKR